MRSRNLAFDQPSTLPHWHRHEATNTKTSQQSHAGTKCHNTLWRNEGEHMHTREDTTTKCERGCSPKQHVASHPNKKGTSITFDRNSRRSQHRSVGSEQDLFGQITVCQSHRDMCASVMRRRPPPPQGTEDAGDGQRPVFDEPVFEASSFLSMARTSFTSWSVKEMWNAAFSKRSNLRIVP